MNRYAWATALVLTVILSLTSLAGGVTVRGAPVAQSPPRPTRTFTPTATHTAAPTDTPSVTPPTVTPTATAPTDTPTQTPLTPSPPTATPPSPTIAPPSPTVAPSSPTVKPTREPQPPQPEPAASVPVAHLALGLTAEPMAPAAEGRVTYSIRVTNDGGARAEGVVVSCDVPAGMNILKVTVGQGTATVEGQRVIAQIGPLDAGASTTIVIETRLKASVGAGVPLSMTASASAEGGLSAISAPVIVQIPSVPSTGSGLTVVLLAVGLLLAAIVLIARGLQMRRSVR